MWKLLRGSEQGMSNPFVDLVDLVDIPLFETTEEAKD